MEKLAELEQHGRPAIIRKTLARQNAQAKLWLARTSNLTSILALSVLFAFAASGCVWLRVAIFETKSVTVYGNYCGPGNGDNYTLPAKDAVDALCRAHDKCIESSFPTVTSIPLRSHTEPRFGCDIMRCDMDFVRRGEDVFSSPSTRGHTGDTATSIQREKRCGTFCKAFLWLGLRYHESKIAQTRAAIARAPSVWKCAESTPIVPNTWQK